MKHSKIRYITGAICVFTALLLIFAAFVLPSAAVAKANSGPSSWYGSTGQGTGYLGENCPLEVAGEVLTFDIPSSPMSGKVTAQYEFVNPTDEEITVNFAFPFGARPDYYASDVYNEKLFSVKTRGENEDGIVRYTLAESGFDFGRDVKKLREPAEDGAFAPDSTVYAFSYKVNGLSMKYDYINALIDIPFDKDKTLLISSGAYCSVFDGGAEMFTSVDNGDEIVFYAIGEKPVPGAVRFYDNYNIAGGRVSGSATLIETETTFREFALSFREDESVISDNDFINGVADYLALRELNGQTYIGGLYDTQFTGWILYDITFAAGEHVLNEVSAPLFPSELGNYSPHIFNYTYLISPAKGWADFGTLKVKINTSLYLLDIFNHYGNAVKFSDFTKVEGGYEAVYEGLPDGEMYFDLCASEDPEFRFFNYESDPSLNALEITLIVAVICAIATPFAGGIAAGIFALVKIRR